jgi:hypothetical protein
MLEIIGMSTAIAVSLSGIIAKIIREANQQKRASEDVREAERQAFFVKPAEFEFKLQQLTQSQEGLEERANEIASLITESKEAISLGKLFNLYSKQIERYQQETRSRATWSFIFAITAMLAGFGFVIWGGSVLLTAKEPIVLAAGGLLSTVGGAISGFITKTFLDVHKLSLTQLNRYFQQPVVNDHILMAQRLAEDSNDPETKKKAYDRIINSITKLIDARDNSIHTTE